MECNNEGNGEAVKPKLLADLSQSPLANELEEVLNGLEIRDLNTTLPRDLDFDTNDRLVDYSLFSTVASDRKKSLVQRCRQDARLNRAMGALCGMGIGDSMGHMFEFVKCQDVPGSSYFDLATMEFHNVHNKFKLEYGQWTDDAAMGLCMADSLIVCRGYNGSDMRSRFWNWWHNAYNNAFRLDTKRLEKHSVGLGGNIRKSLSAMDDISGPPPPIFESVGEDAGNGSLMRFAPIAIFYHAVPSRDLYYFARQSSYTTHPGIIAAEGCALLSHMIVHALNRSSAEPVDPKQFLEDATREFLEISGVDAKPGVQYAYITQLAKGKPEQQSERCWAWREESLGLADTLCARGSSYNGYPVLPGYFGSFSMDGLAIAMWAVYHTNSFDDALTKAINTCGDADSHGSICCQIAGALYGFDSINPQFLEWLNKWDDHEFAMRAILLHELGSSLSSVTPGALQ